MRLSKVETGHKVHLDRINELERRHEAGLQGAAAVGPRTVAGPRGPTPEERAARDVLHVPPADWRVACQLGNATSEPRRRLTRDK